MRQSAGSFGGWSAGESADTRVRWGRLAFLVVSALLVVWGILATVWTLQATRDLEQARADFSRAESLLRSAELSEGITNLDRGVLASERAAARLNRTPVAVLRGTPLLGANLRAATTLAEAGRDVGGAALDLLEVALRLFSDDHRAELGEFAVSSLSELGAPLDRLVEELEFATHRVRELPTDGLVGRVAAARQRYLDLVEPQLTRAALGTELVELVPDFLGASGPRRYLVGAAAPSEARGSLGLMGSWSVLTADQGRLDFAPFADIDRLEPASTNVPSPHPDISARYAAFGALRSWRNANMTPDFPSAAQVYLSLWERTGGPALDGVILADPVVFERLVARGDSIEVPGVTTLTSEGILPFVGVGAYAAFDDEEERKRVLGAIATAAFAEAIAILEDDDVGATIELLASLPQGGHLLIYSADPVEQSVIERAGLGGELAPEAQESLTVAVNNAGANKVDFFTERRFEHVVELQADGTTAAALTAEFTNQAPTDGLPRYVLGPWLESTDAGDNLSWVSVFCGTDCRFVEAPVGSRDGGRELGRPVRDLSLLLPAGERRTVRYATRTTQGWWWDGDRMVVEVEHFLAPTLFGTDLTVEVVGPEGAQFTTLPPGALVDDDRPEVARWQATSSGRILLEFELDPGTAVMAGG